ncbi:MAG TPA: DNA methyltransferase [Candidatus Nanoarchaeia archaeon]|nr:DNA methyltransferase [Candidatus Nanoarchaeia archaeon]
MKLLFVLSKDNVKIAKAEVLALINTKKCDLDGNFLALEGNPEAVKNRLAYTHKYHDLLFTSNKKDFAKKFSSFPWQKVYKKNFCLRIHNPRYSDKEMAGYIWDAVKNPKVDLENPETMIECFFSGNRAFCGRLIEKTEKHFDERKTQNRPSPHPTSLHPKLARAMVNLSGAERGEEIFDPMCGSGGILIEAGLIGLKARGTDIDKEMVERAKANLDFFGIKKYSVREKDALKIGKEKYVVTDLPYGKNTKKVDVLKLYNSFLGVLKRNLRKRAVIGFPDFVDYKKLIKKNRLKILNEFDYYLHQGLSKKIAVIA